MPDDRAITNGAPYYGNFMASTGGGLGMAPIRAIPDSPEFCRTCGVVIRVQIFRGTGYCSTLCEKKGKEATDDTGDRDPAADRERPATGADPARAG